MNKRLIAFVLLCIVGSPVAANQQACPEDQTLTCAILDGDILPTCGCLGGGSSECLVFDIDNGGVGAGEQLEVALQSQLEINTNCRIEFSVSVKAFDGATAQTELVGEGTLSGGTPNVLLAVPSLSATTAAPVREYLTLIGSGEAHNCTLEEFGSFSATVAQLSDTRPPRHSRAAVRFSFISDEHDPSPGISKIPSIVPQNAATPYYTAPPKPVR